MHASTIDIRPAIVVGPAATPAQRRALASFGRDVCEELCRPVVVALTSDHTVTDFSAVVVAPGLFDGERDAYDTGGVTLHAEALAFGVPVLELRDVSEHAACGFCDFVMVLGTTYEETGTPCCVDCTNGGNGCEVCGDVDGGMVPAHRGDGVWVPLCEAHARAAGMRPADALVSA